MLRGLANADGFAIVAPGSAGAAGDEVPFVPLPLTAGGSYARRRSRHCRTSSPTGSRG